MSGPVPAPEDESHVSRLYEGVVALALETRTLPDLRAASRVLGVLEKSAKDRGRPVSERVAYLVGQIQGAMRAANDGAKT